MGKDRKKGQTVMGPIFDALAGPVFLLLALTVIWASWGWIVCMLKGAC